MSNVHFNTIEGVEEYYNDPAISQSFLKRCYSFSSFNEAQLNKENSYDETKRHNKIGSAVDVKLTMDIDVFSKEFFVSSFEDYPSENIMRLCRYIYEKNNLIDKSLNLNSTDTGLINEACEVIGVFQSYKPETRFKKVIEQGDEFYEQLKEADGKIILSYEESMIVNSIVERFHNNEHTGLTLPHSSKRGTFDRIQCQKHINWTMMGEECKALIDILVTNNKTIVPIDVKTMEDDVINFPQSFWKFGYNIQAAFYTEGLRRLYPGYEISPFEFHVMSKRYPESEPMIYRVKEDTINETLYGVKECAVAGLTFDNQDTRKITFKEKIGIMDLIDNCNKFFTSGDDVNKHQWI